MVGRDPRINAFLAERELSDELLAGLEAAASVIGHPDDAFSIHLAELIAKAKETRAVRVAE